MKASLLLVAVLPLLVSAATYYRQVQDVSYWGWQTTHVSVNVGHWQWEDEAPCEPQATWMKRTNWAICVANPTSVMPSDCWSWNATACLKYIDWVDCEYLIYQSTQSACVLFHRTLTVTDKEAICQSPTERAKYSDHVKCQERVNYSLEYMGIVSRTWSLAPESRFPTLYPPLPPLATMVKRIPSGTRLVEKLSF
jgi:hypothetical protein